MLYPSHPIPQSLPSLQKHQNPHQPSNHPIHSPIHRRRTRILRRSRCFRIRAGILRGIHDGRRRRRRRRGRGSRTSISRGTSASIGRSTVITSDGDNGWRGGRRRSGLGGGRKVSACGEVGGYGWWRRYLCGFLCRGGKLGWVYVKGEDERRRGGRERRT
jgi:hypothetical protein